MSFTKFASFEDADVLEVKGSPTRQHTASLDRLSDFHDYRTDDGFMYVRLRAISSRVNKNNDGWPSIELAGGPEVFERHAKQSSAGFTVEASEGDKRFGFATFMGKPNFIDHNNSDPSRARGVVVDAKLRVLPQTRYAGTDDYWNSDSLDPEHAPPTEIELLLEIDAKQFPKYAKAVRSGDLDGFSMGCDVERSKCSHCGHVATSPEEYCSHILMKGAHHDYKTADGKRISRKSYENCYGIHFFEISGVFDPADETALAREVRAGIIHEGEGATCKDCGKPMNPVEAEVSKTHGVCGTCTKEKQKAVTGGFMKGSPDPGDDAYFGGKPGAAKEAFDAMKKQYGDEKGEEVYYATRNKHKGKSKKSHGEWPNEAGEWPWDVQHAPERDEQGRETVQLTPHYPNVLEYLERLDPTPEVQQSIEEHRNYLDHIGYPRPMKDPSDPRVVGASVHTAENPLPQSFETSAPEPVDTMRNEHNCPICGETMDGETCDVCGYVEPPKGMDNPDLTKAKELQGDVEQASEKNVQEDDSMVQHQEEPQGQPMPPVGGPQSHPKQPGSFLQTRNRGASASVMGDMRWQPKLNPKAAARIKQFEKPLLPSTTPATNDPQEVVVTKSPQKPVTAAMRTAQDLIEAAKHNQTGDTMSTTHTADGPTGPEASPDARVDVTGTGGVMDANNDAASKAEAQVDVTGVGSTGVTDVGAEKTESLPTAGQESDDSGFDATKTTEDSGPTKTFDDSDGTEKAFTDSVTTESLEGNQNKDSSVRQAYDSKPFYDQPGLSGGSANKGTEPADPVGKAEDRVDVLQPTTTPDNNSGPTSQWTGTEGNAVERQQDPVTTEVSDMQFDGFTSHFVAGLKLADMEVDLGLIEKDDKYDRLAQLSAQSDEEITAQMDMLSRVKTAGTKKLAQARTAGVTRMPGAFGRTTAAAKRFAGDDEPLSEPVAEDVADAALFSR